MVNEKWIFILNFYKRVFGFPYDITNYLANREVIRLACCGYSVNRISKRLKLEPLYVRSILYNFTDKKFLGLEYTIKSPLAVYKSFSTFEEFKNEITTNDYYTISDEDILLRLYELCKTFLEKEKEIEKYGYV
jgi:hypothetical protein